MSTYTETQAVSGRGSVIAASATSGGSYTVVSEIASFPGNPGKWATSEATNFQSTATEFIPTIIESPDITLKGNRVSLDPGQEILVAAFYSGSLVYIKETLNKAAGQTTAGDVYTFAAYVAGYEEEIDPKKEIAVTFTLKVTNGVARTQGS